MVHEVWGQKDNPSLLDRNSVQILTLSFHITGHHAPGRTSFHPKQDRRTSFMIPNHPGFRKIHLVKVEFPPFWHPFCWFSPRKMGQNGVSGQVLLRFAPFLLQWYFLFNVDDLYKNNTNQVIGRWDMREWWWKIGFTLRAIRPIRLRRNWQHLCSGAISSYLWVLSLIVASPGHHTQFTF